MIQCEQGYISQDKIVSLLECIKRPITVSPRSKLNQRLTCGFSAMAGGVVLLIGMGAGEACWSQRSCMV